LRKITRTFTIYSVHDQNRLGILTRLIPAGICLRTTDQFLGHKKTIDCDMALNKRVVELYEQ